MLKNNYVDVMALVKKSAWQQVDGYSHIERGWEDYDFWLKFVDAGLTPGYVPEILCRYRVHEKSRTATDAFHAHEDLKVAMAFRHSNYIFSPSDKNLIDTINKDVLWPSKTIESKI